MKAVWAILLLVCFSFALSQAKVAAESRQNVDNQLTGHVSVSGGTNINVNTHGLIASSLGKLFNFIFSIYKNIGSLVGKILTDSGVGTIKLLVGIRKFINRIVDFAFGLATGIVKFVIKLNLNIFKLAISIVRGVIGGVYKLLEAIPIIGGIFKINHDILNEFTGAIRKQLDGFVKNEKSYLLNHKAFLLPRIKYIIKILKQLDKVFVDLTEKPGVLIRNEFWKSLRKLFEQQIKFLENAQVFFETDGKSGSLGFKL